MPPGLRRVLLRLLAWMAREPARPDARTDPMEIWRAKAATARSWVSVGMNAQSSRPVPQARDSQSSQWPDPVARTDDSARPRDAGGRAAAARSPAKAPQPDVTPADRCAPAAPAVDHAIEHTASKMPAQQAEGILATPDARGSVERESVARLGPASAAETPADAQTWPREPNWLPLAERRPERTGPSGVPPRRHRVAGTGGDPWNG